MANLTKSLSMPNGQEYEFVGKHWYGTCSTAAATQIKQVSITGFRAEDLIAGTQVTVLFVQAPSTAQMTLNISNTGSKLVYYKTGVRPDMVEFADGSVITFCYAGDVWYIVDGSHATTTNWGKTKLSNSITNDQTVALTPKAVYDAGYVNAAGAAAAAPVQSVNGQTGAVSLTIPTVPTNVSAFNNDAGYLTLATLPIWDGGVE